MMWELEQAVLGGGVIFAGFFCKSGRLLYCFYDKWNNTGAIKLFMRYKPSNVI